MSNTRHELKDNKICFNVVVMVAYFRTSCKKLLNDDNTIIKKSTKLNYCYIKECSCSSFARDSSPTLTDLSTLRRVPQVNGLSL